MYLYTIYKQIGFDLGAQLEELQESAVHKDSALAALRQRLAATENDLKVRREAEGGEGERGRERTCQFLFEVCYVILYIAPCMYPVC